MCNRCDQISLTIARYQQLKQRVIDQQMQEGVDHLLAKLEAEKLALHPEK